MNFCQPSVKTKLLMVKGGRGEVSKNVEKTRFIVKTLDSGLCAYNNASNVTSVKLL